MHYTLLNVRHCVAHCVLGEALRTVATQISSALVVSMAAAADGRGSIAQRCACSSRRK